MIRGGKRIPIGSKQSFALARGDELVMLTGGGAGYGEPSERSRELVGRDLTEGVVAPRTARRVYRFIPVAATSARPARTATGAGRRRTARA